MTYPSVAQAFEKIARLRGEKVALIESSKTMSFRELDERSNALAGEIIASGLTPGDVIGLHLPRGIDYVVAVFAAIKAQTPFLPIDPNLPESRKQTFLDKGDVNLVLTKGGISSELIQKPVMKVDEISTRKAQIAPAPSPSTHPLYITFTSGSTGMPKGVIGTQKGVINRVQWMERTFPYYEDEVLCQKTALSFVDHIAEIFQALLSGHTLVIIEDADVKDVDALCSRIAEYNITRIVLVPSLLRVIAGMPTKKLEQFESLRFIFCSGETLAKSLAHSVTEKLPLIRLINIYGSSEVSADVTYHEFEDHIEQRVKRLFSEDKRKAAEKRSLLPELVDAFKGTRIPDQGLETDEYNALFESRIAAHAIDVSDPLFIGHMTSGIPTYFHELSKRVTELNQNVVKVESSGSLTYLEKQTIAQFHRLVYCFREDYYDQKLFEPTTCFGVALNGGTIGNIQALYAARQHALLKRGIEKNSIEKEGFNRVLSKCGYRNAVIIGSRRMHYSIKKACLTFGMGEDQLLLIDTDTSGSLDFKQLEIVVDECRKKNWLILAMVGIAGATETGAIDPLEEMGNLAFKHDIHFHVDAAWGGACLFSSELRKKFKGIERADSVSICGHKQLYLPMGISVLLFKKPSMASKVAFHTAYQARPGSQDLGQFSLIGSKPAIASFLHAGLMVFGMSGYRYLVEQGYRKAQYFAGLIDRSEAFELVGRPQLNIVNYRYIPEKLRGEPLDQHQQEGISQVTHEIQQQQFKEGKSFVSFTELPADGAFDLRLGVFRSVILNPLTTYDDFTTVLNDQLRIAEEALGEPEQKSIEVCPMHQEVMSVPIGRPIDNASLYLLDEHMKEVPIGEPGEIYVGGDVLSQGYLGGEQLTESAFIAHPKDANILLFRTGDFGRRLSSGAVEFMGRKDQQVKVRGVRIEIAELEEKLQGLDVLTDVAVIPKRFGEDLELTAFYTATEDVHVRQLREGLSQTLPDYMIPSRWTMLDQLPLLPSGKIDRKALSDWETTDQIQEVILEGDPLKKKIVEIMRKVDPHVTLADNRNFFEMGFNSLSLNQVLISLRDEVGDKVQLIDLFTYSTLDKLTQFLTEHLPAFHLSLNVSDPSISRRSSILSRRKKVLIQTQN